MRQRRLVAIVVMLGILLFGIVRPAPAWANAGTNAAIAAGATVAYVGVVLLFTQVIYRSDLAASPAPLNTSSDRTAQPPVKLTPQCPQSGELVTLVCW